MGALLLFLTRISQQSQKSIGVPKKLSDLAGQRKSLSGMSRRRATSCVLLYDTISLSLANFVGFVVGVLDVLVIRLR